MKKILAAFVVLSVTSFASASISAHVAYVLDYEPLPGSGQDACAVDIVVNVVDDNFSFAGAPVADSPWVTITSGPGEFYNHDFGGNSQPNPLFMTVFPDLEFDTFTTQPEGWPNTTVQGIAPGVTGVQDYADTYITGDWFMEGLTPTTGEFVIARLTILCNAAGSSTIEIDLNYGGLTPGLQNLSRVLVVCFPETNSFVLLALGGLAVAVKQRRS